MNYSYKVFMMLLNFCSHKEFDVNKFLFISKPNKKSLDEVVENITELKANHQSKIFQKL